MKQSLKFAHLGKMTALATAMSLSLAGCLSGDDSEPTNSDSSLEAPNITMNLPVSLSGVVASGSQKASAGISMAATDPSACEELFDPHADFMENGYSMTRFLVGLSQQQSCFADFIMGNVVAQGSDWINQGVQSLPADVNDPEAPSHVQVEQSGDTAQVWLYFATPGSDLPADLSSVQTLYLTWTGSGDDVTGQFYMVNMPQDPADPDAPEGIRVDFNRTASTASNKIYIDMRSGHSGGMDGFRIDVDRTGVDDSASYSAKGLITFLGQPFPNLPTGLALPEFAAAAVVDANGLGAATASFNQFAVSLINDADQNGTVEPQNNEFDLGSYQFDISDTTYFDPSMYDATDSTTPFVTQITEWRNKSVSNATYVADHARIEAAVPQGLENYTILQCLERDICDYNNNGMLDVDYGEWEGFNLSAGYFTNTCVDDASEASDCDAFVGKMFEQSLFGISYTANSTDAEPSDDWRQTQLAGVTQLSTVHPDDDATGATTFDIPAAPVR